MNYTVSHEHSVNKHFCFNHFIDCYGYHSAIPVCSFLLKTDLINLTDPLGPVCKDLLTAGYKVYLRENVNFM